MKIEDALAHIRNGKRVFCFNKYSGTKTYLNDHEWSLTDFLIIDWQIDAQTTVVISKMTLANAWNKSVCYLDNDAGTAMESAAFLALCRALEL